MSGVSRPAHCSAHVFYTSAGAECKRIDRRSANKTRHVKFSASAVSKTHASDAATKRNGRSLTLSAKNEAAGQRSAKRARTDESPTKTRSATQDETIKRRARLAQNTRTASCSGEKEFAPAESYGQYKAR